MPAGSKQSTAQERWLNRLYKTSAGRVLLDLILSKRWFSKLSALPVKCIFSKSLIKPFIRQHQIDLSLYQKEKYRSFNDFFIRKIKPENRPFARDARSVISPADGMLSVLTIDSQAKFSLKGHNYSLSTLLNDQMAAAAYENGLAIIIRLRVQDYHRYIFMDDGKSGSCTEIKGKLHTVSPAGLEQLAVWQENSRIWQQLFYENIGEMIQIEIGALLVGKIVNHQLSSFSRGDEKGYFCFGGSTIVLLTRKDQLELAPEYLKSFQQEIPVLQGETIATVKSNS